MQHVTDVVMHWKAGSSAATSWTWAACAQGACAMSVQSSHHSSAGSGMAWRINTSDTYKFALRDADHRGGGLA